MNNFLDKTQTITIKSKIPYSESNEESLINILRMLCDGVQDHYECEFKIQEFTPKSLQDYVNNYVDLFSATINKAISFGKDGKIDIIKEANEMGLQNKNLSLILNINNTNYITSILLSEQDKILEVFEEVNPKVKEIFEDIKKKLESQFLPLTIT